MNEHCNLQDKRESGPLVSVVVDTYNHEAFIGQAIASVLQQEYQLGAVEVLVVDDGSQDGTAKQLAAFTNPPENTGSPSPWFGGLKLAAWSGDDRGEEKGKLVAVQGKNVIRKNRGRRATGHDGLTTIRLSADLRESVDAWAAKQSDKPARAEAILRLVELGLETTHRREALTNRATKASEMAAQEIDRLGDLSATDEERQLRKRRLIKGPKEFRGIRKQSRED